MLAVFASMGLLELLTIIAVAAVLILGLKRLL